MIRYSPVFQVPIPDGRFGRFLHTLLGSKVVVSLLMSRRQKTYHAIDQKNDTKIPQVFYAGGPRYDSM